MAPRAMPPRPVPLRTARLTLRPVVRPARGRAAPETTRPGDPPAARGWPSSEDLALLDVPWAGGRRCCWLVCPADTGGPAGTVALRPGPEPGTVELGYTLVPVARGRGLAAEAVRAVLDWLAQRPGCPTVVAEVAVGHDRSARLLTRLGFQPTDAEPTGTRYRWPPPGPGDPPTRARISPVRRGSPPTSPG